jgi:hypothetical protein
MIATSWVAPSRVDQADQALNEASRTRRNRFMARSYRENGMDVVDRAGVWRPLIQEPGGGVRSGTVWPGLESSQAPGQRTSRATPLSEAVACRGFADSAPATPLDRTPSPGSCIRRRNCRGPAAARRESSWAWREATGAEPPVGRRAGGWRRWRRWNPGRREARESLSTWEASPREIVGLTGVGVEMRGGESTADATTPS